MALTAALKAQIAAWYKALQEQIPDFIPRPPQRQMIADVAKTLAGEEGRHLAIEAPTGVGKTLSYLIPGIAIAREEQKTLVVSTANVALQDQIYSKDLPLLRKIIPDLRFTAAFGRGRYVCPRNLAALASTEPTQQDLLAFLDDELTPNNQAEQKLCATLKADLDSYKWDGLRDHTDKNVDDSLLEPPEHRQSQLSEPQLPLLPRMPLLRRPPGNPGGRSGGGEPCAGDGGHGERSGAAGA